MGKSVFKKAGSFNVERDLYSPGEKKLIKELKRKKAEKKLHPMQLKPVKQKKPLREENSSPINIIERDVYVAPSFSDKQKTLFKRIEYLRENATPSEVLFLNRLKEAGIKFIFQKGFIDHYYYIVDFYLPKPYKTVIEIDGGYHKSDDQQYKDMCRDRYLRKVRGFRVIRILNEDVGKFDISIFK